MIDKIKKLLNELSKDNPQVVSISEEQLINEVLGSIAPSRARSKNHRSIYRCRRREGS